MKRCLGCDTRFEDDWTCPSCGYAPERRGGVPCFAPDLAEENDGYPADLEMPDLDEKNFLRHARTQLFSWALGRWFGQARSVFELGCGNGRVLHALTRDHPNVALTGGEIYVVPLLQAQRALPGIDVLQVDGRALPFCDHFDVAAAFDVIEHIDDDEAVLAEMHGALKPGGGLLISVPQHAWLWSQRDVRLHHKRRYDRRMLVGRAQAAGFEVLDVTSFVSLPLAAMALQAWRNKTPRDDYDPHAELKLGGPADRALRLVLGAERTLIRAGVRFPMGGSLLLIARRPA